MDLGENVVHSYVSKIKRAGSFRIRFFTLLISHRNEGLLNLIYIKISVTFLSKYNITNIGSFNNNNIRKVIIIIIIQ